METVKRLIKEYGIYVLIIVIVILIKTYLYAPIMVKGESMYPTLHNKDIMILDKIKYKYSSIERFDIVVIRNDGKNIIKRVIGLPGDSVDYIDSNLYINGKMYVEKYLDSDVKTLLNGADFEVDNIPDDYYFVLGDNREVSKDSRSVGLINKKDIEGKATITIFPFDRLGSKN